MVVPVAPAAAWEAVDQGAAAVALKGNVGMDIRMPPLPIGAVPPPAVATAFPAAPPTSLRTVAVEEVLRQRCTALVGRRSGSPAVGEGRSQWSGLAWW